MDEKKLIKSTLTNIQQFINFLSQHDYKLTSICKNVCNESVDDCAELIAIFRQILEEHNVRDWHLEYGAIVIERLKVDENV